MSGSASPPETSLDKVLAQFQSVVAPPDTAQRAALLSAFADACNDAHCELDRYLFNLQLRQEQQPQTQQRRE